MTTHTDLIQTHTFDLKPGDTIRINGEDLEVFDAIIYTAGIRAIQVFLPSGSSRTIKGDEFVRVVKRVVL